MEIAFSVPPARNEAGTVLPCSELFELREGIASTLFQPVISPCPVSVSDADRTFRNGILSRGTSGRLHVNLTLFFVFSASVLDFL